MDRDQLIRCKQIFGASFIGPDELRGINDLIALELPQELPELRFSHGELVEKKNTHLLLLTVSHFLDQTPVSIISLRRKFGMDPSKSIPCFYNQDWYINEPFARKQIETQWLLVSKMILDETRKQTPISIVNTMCLPTAIDVSFAFFANYLVNNGEKIWNNDYLWCSDVDSHGDQIYVGRYTDPSGVNKDGFEIHRHLSIKSNYGAVNISYS